MRSREVALHDCAEIQARESGVRLGCKAKLKNRRVMVARKENGDIYVEFRQLTPSKKMAVLNFGLSDEAAHALYEALGLALRITTEQVKARAEEAAKSGHRRFAEKPVYYRTRTSDGVLMVKNGKVFSRFRGTDWGVTHLTPKYIADGWEQITPAKAMEVLGVDHLH